MGLHGLKLFRRYQTCLFPWTILAGDARNWIWDLCHAKHAPRCWAPLQTSFCCKLLAIGSDMQDNRKVLHSHTWSGLWDWVASAWQWNFDEWRWARVFPSKMHGPLPLPPNYLWSFTLPIRVVLGGRNIAAIGWTAQTLAHARSPFS